MRRVPRVKKPRGPSSHRVAPPSEFHRAAPPLVRWPWHEAATRATPLMGFCAPSTFEDWRSHSPGACLAPFVALPGFLTLSAPCSPPGRPALFHAGDALGVHPFRAFPSRGAVPPLGGRCPHDVDHSPWSVLRTKPSAAKRGEPRCSLPAISTPARHGQHRPAWPARPAPEGTCRARAGRASPVPLPRAARSTSTPHGPEGPPAAVASRAVEPAGDPR